VLVEFESVVEAVRCAAALRDAVAQMNQALVPERRVALRTGSISTISWSRMAMSSATASTLRRDLSRLPNRAPSMSRSRPRSGCRQTRFRFRRSRPEEPQEYQGTDPRLRMGCIAEQSASQAVLSQCQQLAGGVRIAMRSRSCHS
jgi:hypothetical protein